MSESSDRPSPGRRLAAMTVLGAIGLLVGLIVGIVTLGLIGAPLSLSVDAPSGQLLFTLGTYLGMGGVACLYLLRHEISLSYVGLRRPTLHDIGAITATTVVLIALAVAIPNLISWLGLPFTEHSVTESIEMNPSIALVFLPLSILVVGPAEEFLYRGIIQTRLGDVFDAGTAIALASLIFAVVHFFAYLDPANVPGTLVTIFLLLLPLGAILGVVYEYTGNLVVPALAHGIYNAITYATVYAEVVGLF
ncbi:MAG: CPBP family intramembrane glutamic endopeptidase [Halobacteriota archaeon]|uniref:CPBP family intramembrane glutamic endopeptidase n=1 Tax=Natronomonas sp. TaxID=2184060 RepID=UPI00397673A8